MDMLFSSDELAEITCGRWILPPAAAGCTCVLDDSRKLTAGSLFVAVVGELSDGHAYVEQAVQKGASCLCICKKEAIEPYRALFQAKGIGVLLVSDTLLAFQQLAAAHRRRFHVPVLAVTGSCGKTSSKEMCAAIFSVKYPGGVLKTEGNTNNHFGVPRNLFRMTASIQAAVIEAGSNHPGEIARLGELIQPTCGLITCIGAAHLEYFKNLEGVAEEKGDIYQAVAPGGYVIMPQDAVGVDILRAHADGRNIITFGLSDEADVQAIYGGIVDGGYALTLIRHDTGEQCSLVWGIGGDVQASNAAGAAAVGIAHGLSLTEIAEGLKASSLPGNRMKIADIGGIRLVNDAYNANPSSMCASLNWFADISRTAPQVRVILGDMRELGDNAPQAHRQILEQAVRLFGKQQVILVGEQFAAVATDLLVFRSVDELEPLLPFDPGTWVFLKASFSIGLYKLEEKIPRS